MKWFAASAVGFVFAVGSLAGAAEGTPGTMQTLTLDACIEMAMGRNHSRPASRFAVAVAEAQHSQALSAYWPQLSLRGAYELMDDDPSFLFPGQTFNLSAPPIPFNLPDQEVTLHDKDSWYASLEAKWLLWDGGMRKGMREQTRAGVDAAREEVRRTDLQVVDSVTRLYYGAVVAAQVRQLGDDTLARMEATLTLTKTMYEDGSGTVKKTDYLDNKVMVETLRSAVALLKQNQDMAQAALAYTIGLDWNDTVVPAAQDIPYVSSGTNLDTLVSEAYAFSPDWRKLEAGIRSAEGAQREARSGYFPRLAITGNLHRWWNDYDKGYATDENKEGWTIRVGLELPLFRGGMTRAKISEASARLAQLEEKKVLLREGIGLQVRNIVLGLNASEKRYQATLNAMQTSVENRDLNTRAYQNDLVETGDVIRSQLMEGFMSAQHYKICYDHAALRSKLNLVVGTEVVRTLTEGTR